MTSRRILAWALAASLLAALIYCSGLNVSPLYLTKDEASFGIQSHALATTGRDASGKPYPLFFQEQGFEIGRDPIYIYATAVVLQFMPLDERALRIPTTLAAVISVFLIVLIAKELFVSELLAVVAGLLLAVTPVFFIRSRAALSVILPVPFQLMWLLFLLRYLHSGKASDILLSTAAVGVGVYSYLSMLFFAPIHFAISFAAVVQRRNWTQLAWAIGSAGLILAPLAVWQLAHPGRMSDIVGSYQIYQPGLNMLQGAKDLLSWHSIATRSDVYWNAFNPSMLFFSGESSPVDSTRTAGLFPLAYLFLLPIGLYDFFKRPRSIATLTILLLFFLGPLTAAIIGTHTIGRYLIAAPLAALLAVAGLARLWDTRMWIWRGAAMVAVLSAVVLFGGFYLDYMGAWRERSSLHLGGNIKGAMEQVLHGPEADAPNLIYLSEKIPYADVYWEFYRRAANRSDLVGRTRGLALSQDDWRQGGGRAVAIVPAGEDGTAAVLKAAGWTVAAEIREFYGGPPTFLVLARS